jgi:pyruvate/2-oxoglutarate dehydrogenase complex dihydrolipoamide acyltransferase (E2) component
VIGFNTTSYRGAAQNYTMPALSPTMTEGNIASWRVKEGDTFSAGDVLLEIETDKATMDVEAQDDGMVMKIISGDGAKGISVGTRIAVMAEPGDDLSNLEIPAEENKASSRPLDASESAPKKPTVESSGSPGSKNSDAAAQAKAGSPQNKGTSAEKPETPRLQHQLSAAVEAILHQNGLSASDASNITGTGPKGRILKGDVLAHLGKINKETPAKLQAHVSKLAHLDLSNIQLNKSPARAPKVEAGKVKSQPAEPVQPVDVEVAVPISLSAVIATQKRVNDTLGIFLPLSTFIARATELANEGLPVNKSAKPTSDDLFNAVLGLDKISTYTRGHFYPHVAGISLPASVGRRKQSQKPDIIDLLTSKKTNSRPKSVAQAPLGVSPSANLFSVVAANGEEKRAEEFLARIKLVLEKEPGRLVL